MKTTANFTFSESHFNSLFPFYILINAQMIIESNGKTLDKIFPGISGNIFSQYFSIKHSKIASHDFSYIKTLTNQLLVLECFNEQHTNLRGQFDYLPDTNQLVFLGSPWFSSIDEVKQNKLSLNDFAFHDSMTDSLHLMKTLEVANEDLKRLLHTVNIQKNELDEANKTIRDLALFTTQDPDPILRINYDGEVLQNNSAAAKLDFIEFENKLYRNDDFFKLIASRIVAKENKCVFEIGSEKRSYSLVCVLIEAENYINIYGRDITQEKVDQLQLNSLSLIIEQTEQAVIISDGSGKVQWVNAAFEKVTGYTIDDVQGKSPGSILQGYETNPETIKYMKRQIRKAKPFRCEVYNYRKSGEGYWKRINCHPIFDTDGKLMQFFAIEEDITSEKEAQEKIKAAANRMSLLISNLQAGILLVNENRKIELVNQRFCRLFKLNENPSELIGTSSIPTITAAKQFFKNPEWFATQTTSLIQNREIVIGEILEMADGGFVERDFIPIWDDGKYNGHLVVYNDITEKVNADKKLEEQRIFYEQILDNIPADIAVFDTSHHYLYVNPQGIKDEEVRKWIIGKRDEDYVQLRNKPLSIAEGRRNLFNTILKTKKLRTWEEESTDTNGRIHYMLRHMSPIIDASGNVKLVIGYAVDITYTKSILLEIEESQKRYRDVVENSLAIVTTHDLNGRFLTVNPMVSKTFGYADSEMEGHLITEFMLEEDRKIFDESYLNKIKKEKTFSSAFRILHKNGDIVYTLCNNFLKEEPGKEPYVIGFAMDITDRVRVENELKVAKKMTEELAQAKQLFLANMSHEIRTPMNAIMGMTNQLSKTSLNKDQRFYLETIHSASDNLLVIINDILDLSKIESGKLSLEHIAFEPKAVIGHIMQVMMHKAEEKGLSFTNSVCDSRLNNVLLGDPYRINQILLNLVSNAIKFTDKGTVDISCKVTHEDEERQTVVVLVSDTGIGMEESFAKNIFRKYSQENKSTTRLFGGTGLGMSICEELIRLMNGEIKIESKKGVGTSVSFSITFVKGTSEQITVKEAPAISVEILRDKRILVTDDNEMNRLVASTILEEYGVIVDEAVNGQEAVEKIKNNVYDIVLMDIQMPVMDGVEATQEIRKNFSKTLPIIALTAFAIKGDNEKFINAGMDDYLSKPFEENQLLQIVCRWVEKMQVSDPAKYKPLYDLNKLSEIAQGNPDFMDKMLTLFTEQIPMALEELYIAYEQNNFDRIRYIINRIKPTVDNLNIESIKKEIQQIELLSLDGKTSEALLGLIQYVDTVLKKVVVAIQLKSGNH